MITKRDRAYIDMCFTAARDLNRTGGARVVALLVYKNMLAWGQNSNKTHPLQAQYGKNDEAIYLHAEIDAIRSMLRLMDPDDLRHCTLYVARAKWNNGDKKKMLFGEARPCEGCQGAIKAFRIKRVIYTNDHGGIEEF
ncbi:MAG: hypothetical protein HC836_37110 [Richelia sp. RM2_1_2]|nr:hypothetical protein [Richelia sp. RM2_1_2]